MVPKWSDIAQSEVWKQQIKPWLEDTRLECLEALVTVVDKDEVHPSLRTYDFLRGRVDALDQIINAPDNAVELERQGNAQENQANAIRKKQESRRRTAF